MLNSQSPPVVDQEWLTAEEPSSIRPARDLDARSNQRIDKWPRKPSIHPPLRSNLEHRQVASDRPSIGRRIFHTLARFSIAVLIGVGATLGWQSHGDVAREMVAARAPTLAWLLSVSTTKSPVVAATTPDPMQQLAPLAFNLDAVRRSVEQLAAKQEQMAQNIAAMQAVEEDIRQKMSFTPPSPALQAASIPQSKPPQPRTQSSAVQSSSVPRPPPPAGPVLLSR
jgi:outer membrane murein-binding lipoprotein Lpp